MPTRFCDRARRRTVLQVCLGMSLAGALPLAAQAPDGLMTSMQTQMFKMQPLACHVFPDELVLALVSVSNETHPKLSYGFRDQLEVRFELDEKEAVVVPNRDLTVVVLGDLTLEEHREHALFRFNIVMDESGSIENEALTEIRGIVSRFLKRIPVAFQAQVIRFTHVGQATPFTNDPDVLIRALQEPRLFSGGTAFYDALDQALTELRRAGDDPPLRFTIAFTDGQDNQSRRFRTLSDIQSRVDSVFQTDQIPIFLGGIGSDLNHQLLATLAAGRGLYMKVEKPDEIERLFEAVRSTLEKTYLIRIPLTTGLRGVRKVYIVKSRGHARYQTIQDVPLPDSCIPR